MLFNSNAFLFVFLPIVLLGFHLLRRYAPPQTVFAWLLLASLVFYGYWQPEHLWLLLASIAFNFTIGVLLARTPRRLYLAAGVIANLALLGVFKYLGFFGDVAADLTGAGFDLPQLALPIGISFFTFTQIAFLVDAYRGRATDRRWLSYGLFVTFFPHLIAGPIVHHREMMPQFAAVQRGDALLRSSAVGLLILAIGLFKKVVIADSLAPTASAMFNEAAAGTAPHMFAAWTGSVAYTLQIYFDFSGYSDMAIGLGLLFGIKFPANFNSPYKATNIIDFWRRWHMTLSRFLRDYLYVPLGGNRHGKPRRYINLMLVMAIGGLWHGAGWTFLLWGVLHGTYLIINHAWQRVRRPVDARWYRAGARALTLLCVVAAWVPFRAESMDATLSIYHAMLGLDGVSLPLELAPLLDRVGLADLPWITLFAENDRSEFYLGLLWILGAAAIALAAPNSLELTMAYEPVCDAAALRAAWHNRILPRWRLYAVEGSVGAVMVGVMLFASIKVMNSAAVTEFLYFNF